MSRFSEIFVILYSVIIVNYKSPDLVLQCLRSVYSGGPNSDIEFIVVDNASGDNSETLITTEFPSVKWLQMGYNSGFARANNEGIRHSSGSIILLLNSDTICPDNVLERCFKKLESDQYIAAGVQLLNTDGSPQISGNYFITGALNYLMVLPYVGSIIRRAALYAGVKKTNLPEATSTMEVDWINGAFLMVKKSAIEQAGLMDEDFFLYSEETEWCHRLGKTGKLCVYGDLHVTHLEGATSAAAFNSKTRGYQVWADKKGFQIMVSHFLRMRKQYDVAWYLFHLLANIITVPVALLILIVRSFFFPKRIGQEWHSWYGYTRNVFKSLYYFFRIIRNRPYFYKVI